MKVEQHVAEWNDFKDEVNMKIIDISDIHSLEQKTLIYFLSKVNFSAIKLDRKQINKFIDKYIASDIFDENSLTLLEENRLEVRDEKIQVWEEKRQIRKYHKNGNIYNICDILFLIDEIYQNMESVTYAIEAKEYGELSQILKNIDEQLIFVEQGILSFMIEDHVDDLTDLTRNYRINPELCCFFKKISCICSNFTFIDQLTDLNRKTPLLTVHILLDCILLQKKLDLIKVEILFICIKKSPEYSQVFWSLADFFLGTIRDLMVGCSIEKIIFQTKELSGRKEARGSNDATTRLMILFECGNEDVYLLRVDFPHKGEEYIHINLEEPSSTGMRSYAYPLELNSQEYFEIKRMELKKFDALFLKRENRLWFKSNFVGNIKNMVHDSKKRGRLASIFKKQEHKKIDIDCSEEEFKEFWKTVGNYLQIFDLTHLISESFGKNEKVDTYIQNIRKRQTAYWKLYNLALMYPDQLVDLKDVMWSIFYKSNPMVKKKKEEIMQLDLAEVLKDITIL